MDVKNISIKVILLCSFTVAIPLLPLIMINQASIVSTTTVIIIIGGYITVELFLLKRKMEEKKKEWLHLGVSNFALSISFLILAIVFWLYGYGEKGGLPSILFIIIYCLSGITFTMIYLKRASSYGEKRKHSTRVSLGLVAGGMIGIACARFYFKDASQNTMIIFLIAIGCILSITFLLGALSFICKLIIKKKMTGTRS